MPKLAFVDFESRSPVDLKVCGVEHYAANPDTDVLCLGWLFDDDAGHLWSPEFYYQGKNASLEPLFEHVRAGGLLVAWNARFDRKIWNEVCVPEYDWPETRPDQWLCAQAQGEANNLPASLDKAAECLNVVHHKDSKGKSLIGALSFGAIHEWETVLNAQKLMQGMRNYCLTDNKAMRDVWNATRPLTANEWNEYHASERINDRGVEVDTEFARAAQAYAAAEMADVNADLARITGQDITVTHHVRKAQWLHKQLEPVPELQQLCEKRKGKGKNQIIKPSADRPSREAILESIDYGRYPDILGPDTRNAVVDFLEAIEAGNSAAVYKFRAIANTSVAGRLHGQYSFNGGGQTGRFSGRGVQIHNLIRATIDKYNADRAIDAMEDILAGVEPAVLVETYGLPISRLLARLLRPTFIAPQGHLLVWADWDQIEARVLPWLSNTPGGRRVLAVFERGDDIYKTAAAGIFRKAEADITDDERQIGKVAVLALGFGGGVGAFKAMARAYGVVMSDEEIQTIVDAWRASNPWAKTFWDDLKAAVYGAYRNPMTWFPAGRVEYLFHPQLMHGTLICKLPDGRWLVYPQFKEITYVEEDEDGNEFERKSLSFVKGFSGGYARVRCWHGTFAENVTQATAASFLRTALVELSDVAVLHTHDEIVAEVAESDADAMAERLTEAMTRLPDWATGLPLSVSVERGPYYTK